MLMALIAAHSHAYGHLFHTGPKYTGALSGIHVLVWQSMLAQIKLKRRLQAQFSIAPPLHLS